MTDEERDRAYTAICHALGEAGEDQAPLFLAMLCLALMERHEGDAVVAMVERVAQALRAGS